MVLETLGGFIMVILIVVVMLLIFASFAVILSTLIDMYMDNEFDTKNTIRCLIALIVFVCSWYSMSTVIELTESKYETCTIEIQDGRTLELTYDPDGGRVQSSKVIANEK